jgi:hypothetical protein
MCDNDGLTKEVSVDPNISVMSIRLSTMYTLCAHPTADEIGMLKDCE